MDEISVVKNEVKYAEWIAMVVSVKPCALHKSVYGAILEN